jgi:hypothetical protein
MNKSTVLYSSLYTLEKRVWNDIAVVVYPLQFQENSKAKAIS